MMGTYSYVTIGDYVSRLPVVITGVNFTWDLNTPWEIGDINSDLLKVPHALTVDVSTKVLHDFAPNVTDGRYIAYK